MEFVAMFMYSENKRTETEFRVVLAKSKSAATRLAKEYAAGKGWRVPQVVEASIYTDPSSLEWLKIMRSNPIRSA